MTDSRDYTRVLEEHKVLIEDSGRQLNQAFTDYGVALWFYAPSFHLNGKAPIDALADGEVDDFKSAVSATLEGGFS